MSGRPPYLRPEPIPGTILVGNAISSGREWFPMAHLANWLTGGGAQLVPACVIDKTITAGATGTLRFRAKTRYVAIERLWIFMVRSATAGANLLVDTGAGDVVYPINAGRDTRLPIIHREVLSSQSSAVNELYAALSAEVGDVEIDSVAVIELPRPIIDQTSEYAVDTNTLRPRERIFSSLVVGESATGVIAAAILPDARRVGIYSWAAFAESPVTRAAAYTDLLTLPVPVLAQLLNSGDTTAQVYWSIYAKVSAGSGDVKLTTSQSGVSDSVNITGTSYAWTTPRAISISCEDMSAADGRQSSAWDDLTVQLRGTGGTLSLASLSIWSEAT